jgi:hypothetical protein
MMKSLRVAALLPLDPPIPVRLPAGYSTTWHPNGVLHHAANVAQRYTKLSCAVQSSSP